MILRARIARKPRPPGQETSSTAFGVEQPDFGEREEGGPPFGQACSRKLQNGAPSQLRALVCETELWLGAAAHGAWHQWFVSLGRGGSRQCSRWLPVPGPLSWSSA